MGKKQLEEIKKLLSEIATDDVVAKIMSLLDVETEQAILDKKNTKMIVRPIVFSAGIDKYAKPEDKVQLFCSLFSGRNDIFAKSWVDKKTGKLGYSPACANEWSDECNKPQAKCHDCPNRQFLPLSDNVITGHLSGHSIVGIYPLLQDEMCCFLAIDFDKKNWHKDISAFRDTCSQLAIDAHIEVSRSGNGAHAWFFFEDKLPAKRARIFGLKLLTQAMKLRSEISFSSYDRLFPNQDIMPSGGFGNLIALPLQGDVRKDGRSVFVDEKFRPYPDQWLYLSSIKKLSSAEVNRIINQIDSDELVDEQPVKPWNIIKEIELSDIDFPTRINIVQSDMLYIEKKGLSDRLLHKLKKLASFKNPEFFKAQAMRLNTYSKSRVISCAEDGQDYLHLPRGLLTEVKQLLDPCDVIIDDKRNAGKPIDVKFLGILKEKQQQAVDNLLEHENGILSAATAFGKTVVAINLIAKLKTNTLILVHRAQLATQWKERLEQFLEIRAINLDQVDNVNVKKKTSKKPIVIGQYGAAKNRLGGIVDIALLQSCIEKGIDGRVRDFVKNYGLVIVDECHHVSAFSFEKVLKSVNARYVYGLTATPKRQDGHDPIIMMQCGPIRYSTNEKNEIMDRNFSHHVIPRLTTFMHDSNDSITKVYCDLSNNTSRNNLIVNDVVEAYRQNRTSIILCTRKVHVEKLANELKQRCKNVLVLIGGGSAKFKRQELLKSKEFLHDEPFVIVATGKYIGEGFDEPRLDTLFLASPISWRGTLEQYVGRIQRNYEGKKEVLVYDYLDIHSSVLTKMYHKRLKGYAALGYDLKAFDASDDGFVFFAKYFANTFYRDVLKAKKRIVISSPYLSEKVILNFLSMINKIDNVEIIVHTKIPSTSQTERITGIIEKMEKGKIKVVLHPKLQHKFAIIDYDIVWHGEINILGTNQKDDTIMRIPSVEIAHELMRLFD